MAEFRTIHAKLWDDQWFTELPADGKMLFVYLITNRRASVAGIYRLPLKVASVEVGIDAERIGSLLQEFAAAGKAHYEDGVLWITKMRNYQSSNSPKVQKRIEKDIAEIPDCPLKDRYLKHYGYPIDTVTKPSSQIHDDTDTKTDTERERETDTDTADITGPNLPTGSAGCVNASAAYFRYCKRMNKPTILEEFGSLRPYCEEYGDDRVARALDEITKKATNLSKLVISLIKAP